MPKLINMKMQYINYKKAIELSPDNATTFFHLGILYHDLNQYNEAIKSIKKQYL